jgi:hypothetical protein
MASFRERIASTCELLQNISEEESQQTFRAGGWSKKEILGHLIDSALNNHQRFVRAALDGAYDGPFYQQQGWVTMHGYKSMAWPVLVGHWRGQNELLCEVVERIPAERLNASCRVGTNEPVTLRFLVDDYLNHLGHHVLQITGRAE